MAKRIGVLVVDDSAYMRKVISNMLQSDQDICVLDTARDGLDALEKIAKIKPDVVTLDVEMPNLDGLSALERIMTNFPTPVIMLSSLTQEGSETTVKALTTGAVDFVGKPSGTISLDIDKVKEELIKKIKLAARADIKNLRFPVPRLSSTSPVAVPVLKPIQGAPVRLVVIGSSTGGPNALQQVIPRIPGNLPAAVLIVQHMPPGFTNSLAKRLNETSQLEVREAREGDILENGKAYVAPGGYHLILRSRAMLGLDKGPPVHSVRPAVDVTLESAVGFYGSKIIGVILTGMGYDGSKGAALVKKAGGKTIAQNEATCVIYGMPRVVVEMGKADKILPIQKVAEEIVTMTAN